MEMKGLVMKSFSNECGSRNSFGYYDSTVKEIILKRPCTKKKDIEEVYLWLGEYTDLKKFSIGIESVEVFVADNDTKGLYSSARGVIKRSMIRNKYVDGDMLRQILMLLKKQIKLRNLSIRCFIFIDDEPLFNLLMETIKELKTLVYLDLTGCYFSPEQLVLLAEVIGKTRVAHLVWPEPRMDTSTVSKVVSMLNSNHSLVVMSCVPPEMLKITKRNRDNLLSIGQNPNLIDEDDARIICEYKDSVNLAFAYEKEKLYNLEKVYLSIISHCDDITPV